jgi:hypothetical protein
MTRQADDSDRETPQFADSLAMLADGFGELL